MRPGLTRLGMLIALPIVGALVVSTAAWADDHLTGVITGRTDSAIIVQTDSARVAITMNDATRISRMDTR